MRTQARRLERGGCSFSFGTSASDRPSASNSRGPAVPSVNFASSRSRSSTLASSLRDLRARDGRLQRLLHRIQPRFDLFELQARPQQPLRATAGRPCRSRSDPARGSASIRVLSPANSGSSNSRLRTVTASRIIESRAVVIGGPIQMIERRFLRVAQIVQNRARGRNRQRPAAQPAAIQRQQTEMLAQARSA